MRAAIFMVRAGIDPEFSRRIRVLRAWCLENGHEIVTENIARTSEWWTGWQRPNVIADTIREYQVELVVLWSLANFVRGGSSVAVQRLNWLAELGVKFHSYREPHLGSASRDVLSTLAELDSRRHGARVRAGMTKAKAAGAQIGRPEIPDRLKEMVVERARRAEKTIDQIAREVNLSKNTVRKYIVQAIVEGKLPRTIVRRRARRRDEDECC